MARKIRMDESRAKALISARNLVRFANCLLPSLICSSIASCSFAVSKFFFVAYDDIGRVYRCRMKNNWMLSCKIARKLTLWGFVRSTRRRPNHRHQPQHDSRAENCLKHAVTWAFFPSSNHFSARQNFSINRRLRYKRLRYWSAAAACRRKEEENSILRKNFSSSRHHKLISREISIVELARRKSSLEKLLIESLCTELSTLLYVNEIVFLSPVCKLINEMISK